MSYKIINSEFDFEFNGKSYRVRKATLGTIISYQNKLKELQEANEPGKEIRMAAYCIYLALKDSDPAITEQYVLENTPATIDLMGCLAELGFMSPKKTEPVKETAGTPISQS